jgi:hypothetical protein
VTEVVPAVDGFTLSVVGGDSLLELRVEPGHEVEVVGYEDEPYLRFRADGTVEENASSPTTYLNGERYIDEQAPSQYQADAEPEWRPVASDGSYAWHDHRVHYMAPGLPDDAVRGQVLQAWTLPLTVDGEAVEVRGNLRVEAQPTWWPWLVVVAAAAAAVWLAVRQWPSTRTILPLAAVGVGGALALSVAGAEQLSFPAEAGRRVLPVALPAVALAAVAAAALLRRTAPVARVVSLAAVAIVAAWALLRLDVFTKPVLPTDLSPTLDRALTAVALGLTIGAAAVLALARPQPADPEEAAASPGSGDDQPTEIPGLAEVP